MLKVLQYGFPPLGAMPAVYNANNAGYMGANSHTQWIGGMPVGIAADGLVVGGQTNQVETVTATSVSNLIGLMMNNYQIDIRTGAGIKGVTDITFAVPTIVLLPAFVEMSKGYLDDVVDATPPFMTDVAWAVRDRLYITDSATAASNGRWTNAASSTNTAPCGVVLKAPADENDTMIAYITYLPDLLAVTP